MNTKKIIAAMLLCVASGSAVAEWTHIASGEDTEVYADKTSISKKGNVAQMSSMYDFVTPVPFDDKLYQSMVHVNQFDCKKSKVRRVGLAFHAGTMAEGEVVYSDKDTTGSWKRVSPGSANEVALQLACGKA